MIEEGGITPPSFLCHNVSFMPGYTWLLPISPA